MFNSYESCNTILPEKYDIPDGFEYLYMITQLAKYYGLSPREAEKMDEMDFWIMREFETLKLEREEYLLKLKFDKQ